MYRQQFTQEEMKRIQIIYKVNGESFDTLELAQMHCKSKDDDIYLYVGSKSAMPFSRRPKWDANETWVEDTLYWFGYHWKREDNKEYAI